MDRVKGQSRYFRNKILLAIKKPKSLRLRKPYRRMNDESLAAGCKLYVVRYVSQSIYPLMLIIVYFPEDGIFFPHYPTIKRKKQE